MIDQPQAWTPLPPTDVDVIEAAGLARQSTLLRKVACGCGFAATGLDEALLHDTYREHKCFQPDEHADEAWHESLASVAVILGVTALLVFGLIVLFTGRVPW